MGFTASDVSLIARRLASAASTSFRSRSNDPALTRDLRGELKVERIDPDRLQRYRAECDFPDDGFLPITFPHALCAALHVGLLSEPGFPFPVFGVVHVRNQIVQRRRIEADESLEIRASVSEARGVRNGYEYDLVTEVEASQERVWNEVTTFLVRAKAEATTHPSTGPRLPDCPDGREEWVVDSSQGRRFALASWDFNPIHISGLFAKLFGFGSAIAH
ncbi:MAG: MaoC/PaaZ C-terminal domain-containing protein, partial [Myxococcota bacterium]